MHPTRAATLLALGIALNALAPLAAAQGEACIVFSELEADPDTTIGEREFVEVWNCGTASVPLAGWKIRDNPTASGSSNTFTFPAWNLAPNGRVVVWGGGAGDGRGPAWSNPSVWNNAGDGASLLDASGAFVDWLGYGSTTPPANATGYAVQAKPGHGQSLQLDGESWTLASPTPGTALGASGGGMQVNVTNVAPTPAFGELPRWVRPGALATLPIVATDPNGDLDVARWSLLAGDVVLSSGTAGGAQEATALAPRTGSAWELQLQVTDKGGLTSSVRTTVALRFSDLVVEMPANSPLAFPAAAPGAEELVAAQPVVIRNLGESSAIPRLDVSAFSGPASFPAEGHLSVGWSDGQGGTTWTAYPGPLMQLPAVAPGASLSISFRVQLPTPLPAGVYGTSFSVVP